MQVWYGTYETTLDVLHLSEEQSSSKCKDQNWISAVWKHIRYRTHSHDGNHYKFLRSLEPTGLSHAVVFIAELNIIAET